MASDFSRQYNDDRWLAKTYEIKEAAGGRCEDCQSKKDLTTHHCLYIKGAFVWEYNRDLLICVCKECHLYRQFIELEIRIAFSRIMRATPKGQLPRLLADLHRNSLYSKFDTQAGTEYLRTTCE